MLLLLCWSNLADVLVSESFHILLQAVDHFGVHVVEKATPSLLLVLWHLHLLFLGRYVLIAEGFEDAGVLRKSMHHEVLVDSLT